MLHFFLGGGGFCKLFRSLPTNAFQGASDHLSDFPILYLLGWNWMFDWEIHSKTRSGKCHILNVTAYLFQNVFKSRTCHQTLPTITNEHNMNKYNQPYQLTAWLFKSRIYISEALSISLRRIYQQSFMEINRCKWSNSCEAANQKASQGQVWEISTITTQSADLHTGSAQNTVLTCTLRRGTSGVVVILLNCVLKRKYGMT